MSEPQSAPTRPVRTLIVLAAALIAALAGALVAYRWHGGAAPPVTAAAAVYAAPRPVPPFELVAHDGSRFDAARLRGRWTLLFFGYANCPDLCPTTLHELAGALHELGSLPPARVPQVALVTVDPARDTPEVLAAYVRNFDRRFLGVTGPETAIAGLAAALGAAFQKGAAVDGRYPVDHSAAVFLIDPEARLAAVFPTPHVARTIAADYRSIVAARGG